MNILICGGRGFIGSHLSRFLINQGHDVTVLTRDKKLAATQSLTHWDGHVIPKTLKTDVIINLCGLNISEKRWSQRIKATLLSSRIKPTEGIVQFIKNYSDEKKPRLINASAIGFYPSSESNQTEAQFASVVTAPFSQALVKSWENAARKAEAHGASVTCVRFGVVLGRDGGMLKKVLPSYRMGLGAILGAPDAYLSWVHIEDLCRALDFIMQLETLDSAYNITSPNPCTQAAFAKALAHICHRPLWLKLPEVLIKLLFGEMGEELLLANQKISPDHLIKNGFEFNYKTIEKALKHLLS